MKCVSIGEYLPVTAARASVRIVFMLLTKVEREVRSVIAVERVWLRGESVWSTRKERVWGIRVIKTEGARCR